MQINSASNEASFRQTARMFGGTQVTALASQNGKEYIPIVRPNLYLYDLKYAIAKTFKSGDSLNVLDIGCSVGFSTLSLESIINNISSALEKVGRKVHYHLHGIDIASDVLKVAEEGIFTKNQIKEGYYLNNYAWLSDLRALEEGKLNLQKKVWLEEAHSIQQNSINTLIFPRFDELPNENYSVPSEIKEKITYSLTSASDLSSFPKSSFQIVSQMNMNFLGDEEQAEILNQAVQKLAPEGHFFSDICMKFKNVEGGQITGFQALGGLTKKVLEDNFTLVKSDKTPLGYIPGVLQKK